MHCDTYEILSDINDCGIVLPVCYNNELDKVHLDLLQQRLCLDPNNIESLDHVLEQITKISTILVPKGTKLHSKQKIW